MQMSSFSFLVLCFSWFYLTFSDPDVDPGDFLKKFGYIDLRPEMETGVLGMALVLCREFGCRDDANAWRKSTKEADKHKKLLQFRK